MKSLSLIAKVLKKLSTSIFVKNFTVVFSGTIVAQLLGLLLSPIISRFYSPADFGIFGSFNSFVRILTAAVTLEYSQALILPKKVGDAFNLLVLSCLCTFSTSLIFFFIYSISPLYFKTLLQSHSSWIIVPLISSVLVSGLNQTFQAWCIRAKFFKHTSASQIIRSFSSNSMQAGLGYFNGGSLALIWSSIVADFFATVNLIVITMRDFKNHIKSFSLYKMFLLAKEFRDFPTYSASMNVINALSLGMPIFLLTKYYGVAVAGSYAFTMRMLSIPMEFVMRALRQVLYQKASETYNDGNRLIPLYIKVTGGLFALAILPSIVLIIWAPQIFGFVFGSKWISSGEFAQSLIIWLAISFCNLPAIQFSRILRIQRKLFLYEIFLLISRVVTLVIGGNYLSSGSAMMLFSLVGAAMNLILILFIGYQLFKVEGSKGI